MRSLTCLLTVVAALPGCWFGDTTTAFPAGLEPLEENTAEDPTGEELTFADGDYAAYTWVHGRGLVTAPTGEVWAALKDPERMAAICDTDSHEATLDAEPEYEFSFAMHYRVDQVITITWDERWRYGTVVGEPDAPELAIVRYQKVYGSELIERLEGSIQVIATDDPEVSELALVEHVEAAGGGVAEMERAMRQRFDATRAAVHGLATPECPPL